MSVSEKKLCIVLKHLCVGMFLVFGFPEKRRSLKVFRTDVPESSLKSVLIRYELRFRKRYRSFIASLHVTINERDSTDLDWVCRKCVCATVFASITVKSEVTMYRRIIVTNDRGPYGR